MDIDLGAIEATCNVIVATANLDAAVARGLAVGLDLQLQLKVTIFVFRQQPNVVVLAAGRRFSGDRAVNDLPVAGLVLVLGPALDDPPIEVLAVEQTRPASVIGGDRMQCSGQRENEAR